MGNRIIKFTLFLLVNLVCLVPMLYSWYPIFIPNEYYELANEVTVNAWSAGTGRILYHHSYILAPFAKFTVTHSFDGIFTYGFLNTIFQGYVSQLFSNDLIRGYFLAYPLFVYLGVLSCASIAYGLGLVPGSIAVIASYCLLYSIGYEPFILASSFNPLRFVGISALVVIFFYGKRLWKHTLIIASFIAVLWNVEFALMCLFAFAVSIIQDATACRKAKLVFLTQLLCGLVIAVALQKTGKNYISSNAVGFIGFSVPNSSLEFICIFTLAAILYFGLVLAFRTKLSNEKYVVCIFTGLLVLFISLKFIFNSSVSHTIYTFVFLGPCIIYTLFYCQPIKIKYYIPAVAILTLTLLYNSVIFYQDKISFKSSYMIEKEYTGLFNTDINFDKIKANALAASYYIEDNKVLIFSPYDYLYQIYAPNLQYCGHFELLSNVISNHSESLIYNCLRDGAYKILVSNDMKTKCPTKINDVYCVLKDVRKDNLNKIFDSLRSNYYLSEQSEQFAIYRKNKQ